MFKFRIAAAALAFAMSSAALVNGQQTQEMAAGHGSLYSTASSGKTLKRQFSFSAHRLPDGSVVGSATLINPEADGRNGQNYRLHIDIQCMNSYGNLVFFGGTTRRTNDPNLVDAVYFSVEDNGEPGADLDRISRVFFFDNDPATTGDPMLCEGNQPGDFPMEPIETGNINVRNEIYQ